MKSSRAFVSFAVIIAILGLIYWFLPDETLEASSRSKGLKGTFSALKSNIKSKLISQKLLLTEDELEDFEESKNPTFQNAEDPTIKRQQFDEFIQAEAKSLDDAKVNTQEKQMVLQARVDKLDEVEKNHLKDVSINPSQPINERILSVYLLTLVKDGASQSLVNEIAQTPLPDFGPSNPHTEAEIRNTQELALRYMAIDKLVQNYKSNPPESTLAQSALQDLKSQSTKNPIQQVRKYAFDELSKISIR